jgi:hypothetical protein
MHPRLWLLLPAGLLMLLAIPVTSAYASVGIGIQAGPVRLSGSAHPGGSYALPPVYVVNTGTQDESVAVRIERISPGTGRTVPPSWIRATGPNVRLSRNQAAHIPLELAVPDNAQPGTYFSDVVARGSGALSAGGANLGVAAATNLQFTVVPGEVAGPWIRVPSWALPAGVGLVLLAGAMYAFRASGMRIRIVREPADGQPAEGQGSGHVA